MLNDPIMQSFLDEIRAAERTGHSAAALEPFFDKLESGWGDLNIELFDAFREVARRQSALSERLKACCELLQKAFAPSHSRSPAARCLRLQGRIAALRLDTRRAPQRRGGH